MLTVPQNSKHHPQPPSATEPIRPGTTETAETQLDIEAHHKPKQPRHVLTRLGDEDVSDATKVSAVALVWLLGAIPGMGMYALHGFLALTLGQAVLRAVHPGDAGYTTSIRATMQIGALGGGVMGIILWTVVLLALLIAVLGGRLDGFSRWMNTSTGTIRKDISALALYTAVGAASGPLGVAILRHHRSADERADMLDVANAARAGALGWFLLAISWLLNHQSNMLKSREH
ncbi:hypothetical protein FOMPIDRAFT_1044799 [Fomitopsis schrenkii]|uniref:Uncharacterized protein n=1 Tax=Fomitopsis schrenkii TaxID=2126942 RepID=S8ER29_FOMSC|nr:hypothetical protein FOMPIDRAFT_1044799 [Fomitopsis schrenkii]